MMQLVDTHCHLGWHAFNADRDAVIGRAIDAGVTRMVTIGVDSASCRQAVELAEQHAAVYAAVGVHPNDAAEFTRDTLDEIRALAAHPKVVAIGEIGLDNYWKRVAPEAQARAFQAQLELAAEIGKPVIIHNHDATEAVLAALEQYAIPLRFASGTIVRNTQYSGVLHSFFESRAVAQRAFDLGFLIGFSGPVTFKKSLALRELARAVPPDRFVVETDAPFLTPEPRRGRRNEPAYVRHVASGVAQAQGVPLEAIAAHTTANAAGLFGWTNNHGLPPH